MRLGATPVGNGQTEFLVWAPLCERIEIDFPTSKASRIELTGDERGYFTGSAKVGAGGRYRVVPDGGEGRPDPASRYQPDGVHGDSEIVDPSFEWTDDNWHGLPQEDYIIYELHVGTFTAEGTFDSAIARLDYLRDLGVTAIELMPVAQFPGSRNWGYDGVLPYAVHNTYGGPVALKRLVNAAHEKGVACILDVVYNHFGPEGNYIGEFAPVFTHKYNTPWGPAVNVDGEHSDGVRAYFIENALEWIRDYHFDALRLDAVHGILDTSAKPFLGELSDAVHALARDLDREVVVIAESDLNDVRMIQPTAIGGLGMDGQWMDDFHHAVHALLTGEDAGYYADYGDTHHLATTLRRGFLFAGDYSGFRKRRHGNDPSGARAKQFVVCIQNHDQVGNRMLGDRLATLVDLERLKLGAAVMLLTPYLPLLFMGEEYGETRPFPYFIHHSDEMLIEAVRKGRKQEFASFAWQAEPPDPQSEATFRSALIEPKDSPVLGLYRELIKLRKRHHLGPGKTEERDVVELAEQKSILVNRLGASMAFCFSDRAQSLQLPLPRGEYRVALNTASSCWGGSFDDVAKTVASPGTVTLEVAACSALLLVADQ